MTPSTEAPSTLCTLWSYDVWGNEEDGWEVNDRCALDRDIDVPEFFSMNEKAILDAIDAGPRCGIDWTQSDNCRIELTDRRNGKPLGCIERNVP
jgi:hypothetical protein